MLDELHNPWVKRLFVGFARTSDFSGPRKPDGPPHQLIQEIDSELPVTQPALQLTYKIFGSCPPLQSFDPSKLLTVRYAMPHSFCQSINFIIFGIIIMLTLHVKSRILGSYRHLIYC